MPISTPSRTPAVSPPTAGAAPRSERQPRRCLSECCRDVLGRLELQLQEPHVEGVQLPQDLQPEKMRARHFRPRPFQMSGFREQLGAVAFDRREQRPAIAVVNRRGGLSRQVPQPPQCPFVLRSAAMTNDQIAHCSVMPAGGLYVMQTIAQSAVLLANEAPQAPSF